MLPALFYHWMAAVEYRQALNNIQVNPIEDTTTINPLRNQLVYFFVPLASFGLILELNNQINRQLRILNINIPTSDKIEALKLIINELEKTSSNTAHE